MNKAFSFLLVILLLLNSFLIFVFGSNSFNSKWEYKIIEKQAADLDRKEYSAGTSRTINLSEQDFISLGSEGWELVSSYLEMETSFPNFGDSQYVTGIQSNVRPQKAVFVFKRPVKPKYFLWISEKLN